MGIEVRPVTVFEDVAAVVGPKRADANVCWCLSYRTPSKQNLELRGTARGDFVRELVGQDPPPVSWRTTAKTSWAGRVSIRASAQASPATAKSRTWTAWMSGAPAIEGYPVDNKGSKVDLTMAYVGTRRLFEQEGFIKAAETESVLNGFPRILMRRDLR